MKTIFINGRGGHKEISLPKNWDQMIAVRRVLWIHENHRDITKGEKFVVHFNRRLFDADTR